MRRATPPVPEEVPVPPENQNVPDPADLENIGEEPLLVNHDLSANDVSGHLKRSIFYSI